MSTRISSVSELSPTGTNITGTVTSNSIRTEAAKSAIVYVDVTAVPGGGAILEVIVQSSPNNTDFHDIGALNDVTATGKQPGFSLPEEKLGTFTRLKYIPSSGTFTLGAKLEKKTE